MNAPLTAVLGTDLPPRAQVSTERGGVAEWLVVGVALIVLVIGVVLTGAHETLMDAIGDAWATLTGTAS